MTANDYLDLLDCSVLVAFNPLAKTIEFMNKAVLFNSVDGRVHEVNNAFSEALRAMRCQKFNSKLYFIKPRHVRAYLDNLAVKERQQKLRLLIS